MGKRWIKGGKEEIFIVLGGKNIILEKRVGGGKNINYLDNIHPWSSNVDPHYCSQRRIWGCGVTLTYKSYDATSRRDSIEFQIYICKTSCRTSDKQG